MNRSQAEKAIHALAESGHVFLLEHAKRRQPAAGKLPLTKVEIVNVLRVGRITEGPSQDIEIADGWKFTMGRVSDGHTFYVAGVVVPAKLIVIITGYEDHGTRSARRPRRAGGIGGDGGDTE
jgi:hypothetical protein